MDADEKRMRPCGLNHHPDGCSHSLGVGGRARCQDTGRIWSGGPAALLDNTLDPQLTPDWPLTLVVTPNQGSHARADSGEGGPVPTCCSRAGAPGGTGHQCHAK